MRNVFLRLTIYCIGAIVATGFVAALFVYWIERQEIRAAKQMINDASQLQTHISKFSDVLAFSRKYHGEANGMASHDQPCVESGCFVIVGRDSRDVWARHPKLGYVAGHIWKRKWDFFILMWVKDGRLTAIEQKFLYLSPTANSEIVYNSFWVVARATGPDPAVCRNPFYRQHRTFAANHESQAFVVWVHPAAVQEREMLRLNVDCVIQLTGCRGASDIVPAAWRAYETDRRLIDANKGKWQDEIANDPECRGLTSGNSDEGTGVW